jgi:hypothetical protein
VTGAAIAPSIIGGCVGGCLGVTGTALTLAVSKRRSDREAAVEAALAVVALERFLWTAKASDSGALNAALKDLDVRLRAQGIGRYWRLAFANVAFAVWREWLERGALNQDRANLRNEVESVVLHQILRDKNWVARAWQRRTVKRHLAGQRLAVAPSLSVTAGQN